MCLNDKNDPVSKSWKILNSDNTGGQKHDGSLIYKHILYSFPDCLESWIIYATFNPSTIQIM